MGIFKDYSSAVVGEDNVVWKEGANVPGVPISATGSPWATITPGGTDSASIASHHTAEGYFPNNDTPDLSPPANDPYSTPTAPNTSLDTRYVCGTLDGTVATNAVANGIQLSWTTQARHLVNPETFILNDNDGTGPPPSVVGVTRSDGWGGEAGTGITQFSGNKSGNYWIGQKDGSNNFTSRWLNATNGFMGDCVNDDRVLSSKNAARFNGVNFLGDPNQEVRCQISLTPIVAGVSYEFISAYNGHVNVRSIETVSGSSGLPSDFLATLTIGMKNTNAGSAGVYPIKDILLATIAADERLVAPELDKWVVAGDSIADKGLYNTLNHQGQTANWNHVLANDLGVQGLYFGSNENLAIGGDSLAAALGDVGLITAELPNVVTFQIGTNNIEDNPLNTSNYQDDLNEYIDTCFGIVGGGGTQLKLFVLNVLPPRFSADSIPLEANNFTSIRAMHLAAPADFAARNPGHTGIVIIGYDAWGSGLRHTDWNPTGVYSWDGTHHDVRGTTLMGEQMAASIISALIDTTAPTLTSPYGIGTDGGPLFTITTSDTLATIEGAGFFDGNAGYSSLLKTGDVVLIKASNGTKMYNVTVDAQARIISLSTGTAIA